MKNLLLAAIIFATTMSAFAADREFSGRVSGVLSETENSDYNRYLILDGESGERVLVSVKKNDQVSNLLLMKELGSKRALYFKLGEEPVTYNFNGRYTTDLTTRELLSVSNMKLGNI